MSLFSAFLHNRWISRGRFFWRRYPKICMVLLLGVLSMVICILLLWLFKKNTSYQPRDTILNLPALTISPHRHDVNQRDEVVQPGDTLFLVLTRLGVDDADIRHLQQTPLLNKQLQQLQANQVLSIRQDQAGRLTDIQFFNDHDNGEKNLVSLTQTQGQWQLNQARIEVETLPVFKAVVIKTSASGALAQADIPVAIRETLRQIFADRLSLDQLMTGDTIRLIYQNLYYHGQILDTGNILAAEISHQNQLYQAYFFDEEQEGNGQYYDEKGQPLRHGFSRAPVDNIRISSPFGSRIHPILHTLMMHSGIDYAAPTGTPIYATADGVVQSIGVRGGYGNTVVLSHNEAVETLYGHMSAFAPLAAGQSVMAGEIIGYVGMTGRATGPHVHYEVRINGQAVNPASMALPARPLDQQQWPAFARQRQNWDRLLAPMRELKVTIAHLD
ncbi:M23 family metallopeptidase [Neisseriaceae bacterium ESL0693]|nr:M23 family metallopeptidase [Neisseriaceae bacterium ESL0693]